MCHLIITVLIPIMSHYVCQYKEYSCQIGVELVVKKQDKASAGCCIYYWLVGKENMLAALVPAVPVLTEPLREECLFFPLETSYMSGLFFAFVELHRTHSLHSS